MKQFLCASQYIDFDAPQLMAQAAALAMNCPTEESVVARCFEFVRDHIRHSWDYQCNPVTRRASEVLAHRTGYCYAKSHLLAALLRANGIPTGLCYQRLSVGASGPPYCLHGLNAVFLKQHGWIRIDARGNKPGVAAKFQPPEEFLAFAIREPQERDLPEIWAEPLPAVIAALEAHDDVFAVGANLPDVALLNEA